MVFAQDVLHIGHHNGHSDVDRLLSGVQRHHLHSERSANGVVAIPHVFRHQFAGIDCWPECWPHNWRLVRCGGEFGVWERSLLNGIMILVNFCVFQNGTFLAPTLNIPMMMFAGFGVTLRDLPGYLKWGSHISYLRYGLEGYVGAIYGNNRSILACEEAHYCHYR